jgi:predicted ATPase
MKTKHPLPDCCRIVLTGGPGGGKTTAADLFRREIGERVVIVPEAATILFQGGFPRSREPHAQRYAQRYAQTAIFHVQRHIEDVQASLYPGRTLLCDRGTIDGAAYWPGEPDEYFAAVGTTQEAELRRYDAVIFFESAAVGGSSIEGGNPVRTESCGRCGRGIRSSSSFRTTRRSSKRSASASRRWKAWSRNLPATLCAWGKEDAPDE